MILIIAGFTIPLLGFLGLKNLFQGKVNRKGFVKAFSWAIGIAGGLSFIFAIAPGLAGNFISPNDQNLFASLGLNPEMKAAFESAMVSDRKSMLQSDAFRSLIFILLSAAVLYVWHINKLKLNYTVGILTLLILADLWAVDKRFLNNDMFKVEGPNAEAYPQTPADTKILEDPSPNYRVLNLSQGISEFNDASTSNYHKSIGGYHGAKLQRYQELIMNGISLDISRLRQNSGSVQVFDSALARANSLNILNTKYIILDPNAAPIVNSSALGNAWLVSTYKMVEGADEEMSLINSFQPSAEALVDNSYSEFLSLSEYNSDGVIELVSYKANELKYSFSSGSKALAVFSEVYYPAGWKSYIDGVEAAHFRADYLLRAMELPSGDHEIIFKFDPDSYKIGNRVSLVSSVILLLIILGCVTFELRKTLIAKKENAENE